MRTALPAAASVQLARSAQVLHAAANMAMPPPSEVCLRICTSTPAGQVTVFASRSILNASLPKQSDGADGACTLTLASAPAASIFSTSSAVPYEASPKTSTRVGDASLADSTEGATADAGSSFGVGNNTSASNVSAALPSAALPGVTSVAVMISESGSIATCPL